MADLDRVRVDGVAQKRLDVLADHVAGSETWREPPPIPDDPLWHRYAERDVGWLGNVPPARAVPGWKCYIPIDRYQGRPVWPPILHGLCQWTTYSTGTHHAACSGEISVFQEPGDPERIRPCRRPVSWGCPSRCGMHSNVWLEECRWGAAQLAIALTASYGRVVRCDSGIGEAWRAEHCEIVGLLVSAAYLPPGHASALAERYRCDVVRVSAEPSAEDLETIVEVSAAVGQPMTVEQARAALGFSAAAAPGSALPSPLRDLDRADGLRRLNPDDQSGGRAPGYLPLAAFVEAAEDLGWPAVRPPVAHPGATEFLSYPGATEFLSRLP